MSKVILTYGTFDLLHIGHLRLLERARAMGTSLIVGVSTDEFNAVKGKKTFIGFRQRIEIVSSLRCVDAVFPESCWEQKLADIARFNADIFIMGSDWTGKFDFLKDQCEVLYLPRTDNISSTQLRTELAGQDAIKRHQVVEAAETCAAAFEITKNEVTPENARRKGNSEEYREGNPNLLHMIKEQTS